MQLTSNDAPTLEACPECGDPMVDLGDTAVCHSCGHKQPVLRVEAHRKEGYAFLAPLAMGALRAIGPRLLGGLAKGGIGAGAAAGEGAAAGGAMSGLGGMMTKALGTQAAIGAAKGVFNSGDQDPDGPGGSGDDLPVGQTPMGTVGATGPGPGVGTVHGEDDNPEHDGTQGFAEEHSDSPEFNKDVNDLGGTSTGPEDEDEDGPIGDFKPVGLDELEEDDLEALANLEPAQVEALAHLGINWHLVKTFADDDEKDGSKNPILSALDGMLESAFPGYKGGNKKEASVDGLTKHAARLPRMCPHHKNLVQTALATGDPATALSAMAQHEYGEKSCNGSWSGEDGGCKYKPQMVTQSYWDEKAQKRQERAEQRQLDAQPLPAGAETPEQDPANDDHYEDDLVGETPTDETFTPDPEWGDQSVEYQSDGESGAVLDFNAGDSAVGMSEGDRQMAARVAGIAETFPEGSKVHWKFYDRGVGTVVGVEANEYEASHDAVEVQWGDGSSERVYPGHLVPLPPEGSQHPGTGHEMQPDGVVPDHMPTEWSDTPDDMQGLVTHASVEDFDFGTKLADKSEFEPADEHGDGHPDVKDESAISGGDNPDVQDTQGQPLKAGSSYLMRTPEYAVPDKVSIDNIDGDKITYTIHTHSIEYQNTMDLADMLTGGYEFEPDTGGDSPDPDNVDPEDFAPDPEATFGDDKGDIHKVENTVEDAAVRTTSTKTASDWFQCNKCNHKWDAHEDGTEDGSCPKCGGLSGKEISEEAATKTADTNHWELVDGRDNDQHDTGTKAEMEEAARSLNEEEGVSHWKAKPEGWSDRNFKGASSDNFGDNKAAPFGSEETDEDEDSKGASRAEGCTCDKDLCECKPKTARISSVQLAESLWHDLDEPAAKTAGADFSPREQREFIHEKGSARNLDRLDLEGTHYPQDDDLSDHFLLGI